MLVIEIEEKKEFRSPLRNMVEWSFTTAMWALWIYLFLPLLTLILWWAGARYFYSSLFQQTGLEHLMHLGVRLGWFVVITVIVLRGWGLYNYYMYGRLARRRQPAPVSAAEMGAHFGLSDDEVIDLQSKKEIVWERLYDEMVRGRSRDDAHQFN
jgi:biofilm PGA synthesis protein PgaD